MKLSILVPGVHTRRNNFLPKSLDMLYGQLERLSYEDQKKVEIIYLIDNKTIMLGQKRNVMIDMCKGKYISFVDDDDRVSNDYIKTLLEATEKDKDVISFQCEVTQNGSKKKICYYNSEYEKDHNDNKGYHRLPNHICAVKRDIALKVPFPSIKYGEDATYARLLKPLLKTQLHIPRILYYYDYNHLTTEAQEDIEEVKLYRRNIAPVCDVVVLSNASTKQARGMTQHTIDTCHKGANGLPVNIIVIEQTPGVSYADAKLVYHSEKFNFNAFNNLGARLGKADWIYFANNDLSFTNGWLHELLSLSHPVMSSLCPNDARQKNITRVQYGYSNGRHFSGWAFMVKRELLNQIGGFDEDFPGWCADDSFIEQLRSIGIKPAIVPKSIVNHLQSVTINTLTNEERDHFTWGGVARFNSKYRQNKFAGNTDFKNYKNKNGL